MKLLPPYILSAVNTLGRRRCRSGIGLLLVGVLTLGACTQASPGGIHLFNDMYFELRGAEEEKPITETAKTTYVTHFGHPQLQLPLFKYIEHPSYDIYVGLPVQTSFQRLVDGPRGQRDTVGSRYTFTQGADFYHKTYYQDSLYIEEYLTQTADQSLIFLALIAGAPQDLTAFADTVQLSARIRTP